MPYFPKYSGEGVQKCYKIRLTIIERMVNLYAHNGTALFPEWLTYFTNEVQGGDFDVYD